MKPLALEAESRDAVDDGEGGPAEQEALAQAVEPLEIVGGVQVAQQKAAAAAAAAAVAAEATSSGSGSSAAVDPDAQANRYMVLVAMLARG